jgi:hypothetical protein
MMKYTKTHVDNPPKNILGWASLDLNDVECFFKFPFLSTFKTKRYSAMDTNGLRNVSGETL